MPVLIPQEVKNEIVQLRKTGHSIPEISHLTSKPKSTVSRLTQGVEVLDDYKEVLRIKQGGSKARARILRDKIHEEACALIDILTPRDQLLLLIGLYWGEGTKRDFGIINSDPYLIQTFIKCLESIGITRDRLSMSIRVHSDRSITDAKEYWANTTGLLKQNIVRVEVIEGKKKGKLPYGMCRIRIRSGIKERLLVQAAITLIGKESQKKILSS